VTFLTLLNIF